MNCCFASTQTEVKSRRSCGQIVQACCLQSQAAATGNPDLSRREVVAWQLGECGLEVCLLQPDSC